MPAQQQQFYTYSGAPAVNLPNGAETLLATSKPVSSSYPSCTFSILFVCTVLLGAAATGIIFRIRQTSLTGTALAGYPVTLAAVASVTGAYTLAATDQPAGDVASFVYVLTANVQGGAAAGTGNNLYSSVTVAV
ncbi:MAG TPA: hypothetical protein VFS60_00360 [Thermoanaerobaculia bacterium]|nr:hypothetical protein [Thermoanaerobaculia bacterium]